MPGITTVCNSATGLMDFEIVNGALVTGSDYATFLLIQLFSSAVTTSTLDAWWGNTYNPNVVGSKLPLLIRAVKSGAGNILAQATDYGREILAPLVAVGVFKTATCNCIWLTGNGTNCIQFNVAITTSAITTPQLVKFGLNPNTGSAFVII